MNKDLNQAYGRYTPTFYIGEIRPKDLSRVIEIKKDFASFSSFEQFDASSCWCSNDLTSFKAKRPWWHLPTLYVMS